MRPVATVALLVLVALHVGCAGLPRNDARGVPSSEARTKECSPANPESRGLPYDGPDCPVGRAVVWRGSFEQASWLHDWDPDAKILYGASNARVIRDERLGNVLRVLYPAGSSSASYAREGHPVGGLEFKTRLPAEGAPGSIFLSYWLRFGPDFQWVKGGKLPGICGGTCPSGGAPVTGYGGWSMRFMWRPDGAGEQYAYILPAQAYGTELGLGAWRFTTGDWHRVAEEIVFNTDGAPNGLSRVWFDADPTLAPAFEAKNLTYRRDETPADTLFFSTFFGGHDAEWATPVDTFIDFARFVVCR